jgi:hypothetical protein
MVPPKPSEQERRLEPLVLPALSGPARRPWPVPLQRGLKDDPVPLTCSECGKALAGRQRGFCSNDCNAAFSAVGNHLATIRPV